MIRSLLALTDGQDTRLMHRVLTLAVAAGITQGIAILLMVPVFTALFRADWPATGWALIVLGVAVLLHSVIMAVATSSGFTGSLGVIRSMHRGLGSTLLRLPLSWFGPESQGRASHSAVRGTLFVATAAMDVLVPLTVSITAPATIAVGALLLDWRVGLVLMAAGPVVYLSARVAARWESAGEERVRGFVRIRIPGCWSSPGASRFCAPLASLRTIRRCTGRLISSGSWAAGRCGCPSAGWCSRGLSSSSSSAWSRRLRCGLPPEVAMP